MHHVLHQLCVPGPGCVLHTAPTPAGPGHALHMAPTQDTCCLWHPLQDSSCIQHYPLAAPGWHYAQHASQTSWSRHRTQAVPWTSHAQAPCTMQSQAVWSRARATYAGPSMEEKAAGCGLDLATYHSSGLRGKAILIPLV